MQALSVVPTIYYYDTFAEFHRDIPLTDRDLIITNRWIYEPYVMPLDVPSPVLFQEDYGKGEPTDIMINEMAKDMRKYPCDRLIAIGGGTVIDIAKVLSLKVPEASVKLFTGEVGIEKDKELVVIPTTCGTGSEVTNVAVVLLTELNTKKGIADDKVYADKAVLIPESLNGLPDYVFATSSIDALIHGVESYLSPKASPFTKMYSKCAIGMILDGYRKIMEDGNSAEARKPLLKDFSLASTYAGIAFGNAGCGPVHAMSYAVGGAFHIAHGESNYLLFTGVLKKYIEKEPGGEVLTEMIRLLAQHLQCEETGVCDALDELLGHMIRKKPLREYGMKESQIETFTDMTIQNQQRLLGNRYTELTREDIAAIYAASY